MTRQKKKKYFFCLRQGMYDAAWNSGTFFGVSIVVQRAQSNENTITYSRGCVYISTCTSLARPWISTTTTTSGHHHPPGVPPRSPVEGDTRCDAQHTDDRSKRGVYNEEAKKPTASLRARCIFNIFQSFLFRFSADSTPRKVRPFPSVWATARERVHFRFDISW